MSELDLWLTRTGLILEVVSFFLIAPEVLGPQRLTELQERLQKLRVSKSGGCCSLILASFIFVIVLGPLYATGVTPPTWLVFEEMAIWFWRLVAFGLMALVPAMMIYAVATNGLPGDDSDGAECVTPRYVVEEC